MIGVTGATGQVGRELVKLLGQQCRPLVRELFDYDRAESYAGALKGVKRLFLVGHWSIDGVEPFIQQLEGIEMVVVMSGIGAQLGDVNYLGKLERWVKEQGIPFVAIRANWFYQNFTSFFSGMVTGKELTFPDGGMKLSFVDTRDIAEMAAHYLEGEVKEGVVTMTGPQSLSHTDVARLFSKWLPYEVGYRELSEIEAQKELGWDREMLDLFANIRKGMMSDVSVDFEQVLGKKGRTFEAFIRENLEIWR